MACKLSTVASKVMEPSKYAGSYSGLHEVGFKLGSICVDDHVGLDDEGRVLVSEEELLG